MTYRTQEYIFCAIILLFGCGLMLHTFDESYAGMAQDISDGPMLFPRILLTVWILCAAGMLVQARKSCAEKRIFMWGRVLAGLAALCLFSLLLPSLGFIATGTIFFISLACILGFSRPLLLVITSVVYAVFIDMTFEHVLMIVLPSFSLSGV